MSHDLKLSENGLKINFLLNVWMCGILDMDMHVVNSVLSKVRPTVQVQPVTIQFHQDTTHLALNAN